MRSTPLQAFDTVLYRSALWLCPSSFRGAYADEMVCDFAQAREEASAAGGGLWQLRLVMAVDVLRTVLVQWTRTGLPAIALISVTIALALAEGAATLARQATFGIPADAVDDEILAVVLVATTTVMLIAMTILLTLWVARSLRRSKRRG
jgi:hypothetical protein